MSAKHKSTHQQQMMKDKSLDHDFYFSNDTPNSSNHSSSFQNYQKLLENIKEEERRKFKEENDKMKRLVEEADQKNKEMMVRMKEAERKAKEEEGKGKTMKENMEKTERRGAEEAGLKTKKQSGVLFWMSFIVGMIALLLTLLSAYQEHKVNHAELRLMLVGKTGAGKSASGNTILGEEAFRVEASPASVSPHCERRNKIVDGRNITVIDTPGVMDTWLMSSEAAHNAPKCISTIDPDPHVFLLVIKVGRFTKEEINAVTWIQKNFGEEALKFTLILFTGGDLLERKPIEKFISNSYELQNLVDTCEGKYHVFNNYERNNRTQVTELLEKINVMLNENMGYIYSKEVYMKIQRNAKEEVEKNQIEKQRKMNDMAIKLRDEQYENIKLRGELEGVYSKIFLFKLAVGSGILIFLALGVCKRQR